MNLIEFLFALLKKFLSKSIDAARMTQLNLKANQWLIDQKDHKIAGKVIKYQDEWYIQILLAFAFLFSVKSIADWLVSSPDDHEDQEGDDDEQLINMIKSARSKKPRNRDIFSNDISL